MQNKKRLTDRQILAKLYAVMVNEPHVGLWEIGATFVEILMSNKQSFEKNYKKKKAKK